MPKLLTGMVGAHGGVMSIEDQEENESAVQGTPAALDASPKNAGPSAAPKHRVMTKRNLVSSEVNTVPPKRKKKAD